MPHKKDGFANELSYILPGASRAAIATNAALRQLYVTDLGYYPHAADHFINRPAGTSEWVLLFCIGGRGSASVAAHTYALHRGDVICLPPQVAHSYQADASAPWDLFWAHFNGEIATALLLTTQPLVLSGLREAAITDLSGRFWQLLHTFARGYTLTTQLLVSTALANLLVSLHDVDRGGDTAGKTAPVLPYLYAHLDDPDLGITSLATALALSPGYLSRLIRRDFGKSCTQLIHELRIKQAQHLLAFGRTDIQSIAHAVGFSDPLYFSRVFKQQCGVSPRTYRQTHDQ